jgi:monothiol glutaredoxin
MSRSLFALLTALALAQFAEAFAPHASFAVSRAAGPKSTPPLFMSDDFIQDTPAATQERLEGLVEDHPVLLFMKGSKLFPQCGFSNTAVQILQSYDIDFHTVDVLSDASIRQGVKEFSQWPTIPQLYVTGEFVGGSDIMIELYQTGELGEMIEKAKADMI